MSEHIPDIFISYSSRDRTWISGLAEALEACGLRVWWDRELLAGDNYHKAIENALNSARCVITVWSEHSVESEWVLAESDRGKARGVLVPLIYRPATIPLAFAAKHNVDLQQWQGHVDEAAFQSLLRALEAVLQRPASDTRHIPARSFLSDDQKQPSGQQLEQGNGQAYWMIAGVVLVCVLIAVVMLGGGRDSGIHTEGDFKIDASGDSTVKVITGDGQAQ